MRDQNFPSPHQYDRTNTVSRPGWEQVFDGRGGLVWVQVEPVEPEVIDVEAVVVERPEPQVVYIEQARPSLLTHRYAVVLYLVIGVMVLLLVLAPAIASAARSLELAVRSLAGAIYGLVKIVLLVAAGVGGLWVLYAIFSGGSDQDDPPPPQSPTTGSPGAVTFNFYVNNQPQ